MMRLGFGAMGRAGSADGGADPERLMFAATRFSLNINANPSAAGGSGFIAQISRLLFGTPAYAVNGPRFYFANWRRQQSGATPTETVPGNTLTVSAYLEVSGVFTQITFSSNASVTLADGDGIWSDAVAVTIPATTTAYVRTLSELPAGGGLRFGQERHMTNFSEGIEHNAAASALTAQLSGGTVSGVGASGHVYPFGPVCCVAKGWDGRPVALLTGDSIAWGQNDNVVTNRGVDSRGNYGYWRRGLDSTAGTYGRIPYGNIAVPGVNSTMEDTAAETPKTLAMIEDAIFGSGGSYQTPFTFIASNMGVNNFDTSTGASRYPTPVKTDLLARIAFLKGRYPGKKYVQSTLTPRTTALSNGQFALAGAYQTQAGTDGTSPNGRWAFNDDLRAGNVSGVDVVVDIEPYFSDTTDRDKWKPLAPDTTLTAQATSGSGTAQSALPFAVDDAISFEPGVAGSENRVVTAISGTGPYTLTLSSNLTSTHANGTQVTGRPSSDGTHPLSGSSKLAMAAVEAMKGSF